MIERITTARKIASEFNAAPSLVRCVAWSLAIATFLAGSLLPARAYCVQDPPAGDASQASPEDAIHDELRELRDRMVKAYEARDLDGLISGISDNIVITWQNADTNHGPEEFRSFFKNMMEGDGSIVVDVKSKFEVDGLSQLYGDTTAVANGTLDDQFELRSGKSFTLNSKWTATVCKVNGNWKVASFHVSPNVFDNAILTVAKSWLVTTAIGAALLGLLLGVLITRLLMITRRKSA